MDKNKSGLYLVAIVGIIAVVALVIMITSANKKNIVYSGAGRDLFTSADTTTDAAGQMIMPLTQAIWIMDNCASCGCYVGSVEKYGLSSWRYGCLSGETERCHAVSCGAP